MASSIIHTPEADRDLMRSSGRGGARSYSLNGKDYDSVTTIIGRGEPKPVLVNWAKKVTAEYAVEHHDMIGQMIKEDGDRAAIDYLKGAAYRQRDSKGAIGSRLHEVAELAAMGHGVPTPEDPTDALLVAHLKDFLKVAEPEWHAIEAVVYSDEPAYAGTLDGIATLGKGLNLSDEFKKPVLIDWKSGSGVYGSHAMQLCAYAWATRIIGPSGPVDMTDLGISTEKAAVVHITAGGWKLVEVNIGAALYETFLATIHMAHWTEKLSSDSVGSTLAAGGASGGASMSLPKKGKKRTTSAPLSSGDGSRKRIAPPKLV